MTSQAELIIKQAEKSDAAVVLNFIKELAIYEKLSHEVTANVELLERTLFSKESNARSLIGYYQNKPVCFAIYFFNFSTFLGKPGLYLEDLFVLPEFRGKGFGKKMLKFLAGIAKEKQCGRFEWSVLDWNEPAIKFYESIGAKMMTEWKIFRMDETTICSFSENK